MVDGERFIVRNFSKPGDTVLDMYGGQGTSTLAALKEGRHAVYFDTDPQMLSVVLARVTRFFSSERTKAATLGFKLPTEVNEVPVTERDIAEYRRGACQPASTTADEEIDVFLNKYSLQIACTINLWGVSVEEGHSAMRAYLRDMPSHEFKGWQTMDKGLLTRQLTSIEWSAVKAVLENAQV